MARILPSEFGLSDGLIGEIRARDEKQARLFARLLAWSCGVCWLVLSAAVYARALRDAPLLGLVMAPLLGGLGAVVAGLPLAIASGVVSWLVFPRHPLSAALERYEAASAGVRECDVCRLTCGDLVPKEGVSYCGRCGAWICPDCRRRYDLRAIAALKRRALAGDATPRTPV